MPVSVLSFRKSEFCLIRPDLHRSDLSLRRMGWKALSPHIYFARELRPVWLAKQYFGKKLRVAISAERVLNREQNELYPVPPVQLPDFLDPHQKEGVRFILSRKRSYLAHAPGAGKTLQAIVAASLVQGPSLFIVPPALVTQWQKEIERYFSSLDVVRAWDDFVVLPDSLLSSHRETLGGEFQFIAVDEASRYKTPFAERSLALYGGQKDGKSYPGILKTARHVVFLDGSPMPNRPIELWAPMFALDPESIDCMTYDDFGYRFCGAKPNRRGVWEYLYSSHENELQDRMRRRLFHVVGEAELTHPERLRSLLFMNQDVRTGEMKAWEKKNLSAIRQMKDDPDAQDSMARIRRQLGLRKVAWIAEYVRDRFENKNESILLFIWHREVASALHTLFKDWEIPAALITGGVSIPVRDTLVKDFQDGKIKILVMNIGAAGRGLNLQRADRVIFGEFSWCDETNKQAEKRASRRGSSRSFVRCEYIVCPDSMDEIVARSLFTKEERVKKVVG